MAKKSYEMDMCNGPLFSKIIIFAMPLMLSGILQLLFNAADMIVVGRYSTTTALAAIGSVGALINFFVNMIIGISVGSNVLVARFYGAKKWDQLEDAVHTSILLSFLMGVIVGLIAILFSRPILILMKSPDDVIDLSVLYIRIYFAGLPVSMLYNFGSSILRAVGDTRRPLIYLSISGVVNVLLNLYFVTQLSMGVEGVALATIISQALSAVLVLRCLLNTDGKYKLELKKLRLNTKMIGQIFQIGIPAGVQSMLFSISNILIQSSINDFGSTAMAGNTACSSIEGFVYMAMNSIYQTNISFSSQNFGAGKYKRMDKSLIYCLIIVTIIGLTLGNLAYFFGESLLSLYTKEKEVIPYGIARMAVICTTYFTCGIMEVLVGSLRGMGYSVLPMIVSVVGVCGLRILWICTYFQQHHTLSVLYMSYPITWVITIITDIICILVIRRKINQKTSQ